MKYEFHRYKDAADYHIYDHGVSEDECLDVLDDPVLTYPNRTGTMTAFGLTRGGRWLKVIYVEKPHDTILIVTAYQPWPATIRRLKRRRRKK